MNFKGFDDYIPIFRGGKQIASNGKEYDGDALIKRALANFNAARHEPPVVIGHPKDDTAPSYGWVESLKKQGDLLMAKFKQVQPDFADMDKAGLFKKRSASFYPDGTLRHVGFLGAAPPAVKGLPDVAFAEGEDSCFEFSESFAWNSIADVFRKMREWLIEKFDQDTADRIIPDWKIDDLRSAAHPPEDVPQQTNYNEKEDKKHMEFKEKMKTFLKSIGFDVSKIPDEAIPGEAPAATGQQFSEADIEKIRTEAEKKGKEAAQAEFAEVQKQTRLSTIKTEIAAFCESLIKAGKITPATVDY